MLKFHKKIVTDESLKPIAIQIDYADWLKIEHILRAQRGASKKKRIKNS